jgi:hypothetical protein
MKTRIGILVLIFCAAAPAQSTYGYGFIAPGGLTFAGHTEATLHLGFGVDVPIWKGLGLGAELGALGPTRSFSDAVGIFSPDASYHFIHDRSRKADPFVVAGYTLLFRTDTANLFNFGGGTNYWFSDRVGFRVEFRDHVFTRVRALHYWGVRIGISFR